jgi:predicted RNase H-like HicB family nuclease
MSGWLARIERSEHGEGFDMATGRSRFRTRSERMASYIALVHKDARRSYGVSFPDVPGCTSAGDTVEQAVTNAAEALADHLAFMQADGGPLPAPRSFDELSRDRAFQEHSADAIVTRVTLAAAEAEAAVS